MKVQVFGRLLWCLACQRRRLVDSGCVQMAGGLSGRFRPARLAIHLLNLQAPAATHATKEVHGWSPMSFCWQTIGYLLGSLDLFGGLENCHSKRTIHWNDGKVIMEQRAIHLI